MKLVGDSKFIAEAYQKIYEDDFMSGINEYEKKVKDIIYVMDFDGGSETPEPCSYREFKDYISPDTTIEDEFGVSLKELKKLCNSGKIIIAGALTIGKDKDAVQRAESMSTGGEKDDWYRSNVIHLGDYH